MRCKVSTRIFLGALACIMAGSTAWGVERPTFTKDVVPIFQENCQNCHRPGQIGSMSLLTYEETRPWAKSIQKSVVSRKMPPYSAHPSSFKMKGDLNLTDEEVATISSWVDAGSPKGKMSDLPPAKVFASFEGGWALKKPDMVLSPVEAFEMGADLPDQYQCFSIPLALEHDIWLKGVEFKPGNNKIVHHYILFEDKTGRFKKFDDATEEPGCECSDMEKVLIGSKMLKMWAPGNIQPLTGKGIGNKISAGNNLILQIHYHNVTGIDQTDLSKFALHLASPDETIMKQVRGQLVNAAILNIKAGDPHSRHEALYTTRKDITVYSGGVHMHARGKSMGMWAQRPDEEEVMMLWVPHFDFNWQLSYEFEEPWSAPKGTVFKMVSHHDNSADNPFNPDPTIDIHWGLSTDEEMSFSGFSYTFDDEALNITPILPQNVERAGGDD